MEVDHLKNSVIFFMRKAFLLSHTPNSKRSNFSKKILEDIGFSVVVVPTIPHQCPVHSNKISMQSIYQSIADSNDDWSYVFEDDINVAENIKIDEIIEYENISDKFFYLGCCLRSEKGVKKTNFLIKNKAVFSISGSVACLHAIALSKKGAKELLSFSLKSGQKYMDEILESFSKIYPANIVRYDLKGQTWGHAGVIFQDRTKFQSEIG